MSRFQFICIRQAIVGFFIALALTLGFSTAQAMTPNEVRQIIVEESNKTLVPSSLALAVAQTESGLRPDHQGIDGARGVFQILSKTAEDMGVKPRDLWNSRTNVSIGIKVLDGLLDRTEGRWDEALRAYALLRPESGRKNVARYVNDVLSWERLFAERLFAQNAINKGNHKVLLSEIDHGNDDWSTANEVGKSKFVETIDRDMLPKTQPKFSTPAWLPTQPSPKRAFQRQRKIYRSHWATSPPFGFRPTRLSHGFQSTKLSPRVPILGHAANQTAATSKVIDASINARSVSFSRNQIQSLVVREARRIGVPAALALAVAKAESNFNVNAHSHKGARGVMQIMPRTSIGVYGVAPKLLWNPRVNVHLGLHFLHKLLKRYQGRVDLALSYYNGGSAVGDLPHARVIPATRKYVEKVRRYRRQFSRQLHREGQRFGHLVAGEFGSRGG
ncbi:transglycosylase SLT domain-containing protein [bacterium]|jgi:soluble lytic murein transglycosylase-like protein|nr:transglycosylase SLT domain-containing protein [bacterium]